jgi:hypothetical protein
MHGDTPQLNPNRLSVEQAAQLLSAAAQVQVPTVHIAADVEAGAPQNADGTLNLVHYAAWNVKQMAGKTDGD